MGFDGSAIQALLNGVVANGAVHGMAAAGWSTGGVCEGSAQRCDFGFEWSAVAGHRGWAVERVDPCPNVG